MKIPMVKMSMTPERLNMIKNFLSKQRIITFVYSESFDCPFPGQNPYAIMSEIVRQNGYWLVYWEKEMPKDVWQFDVMMPKDKVQGFLKNFKSGVGTIREIEVGKLTRAWVRKG